MKLRLIICMVFLLFVFGCNSGKLDLTSVKKSYSVKEMYDENASQPPVVDPRVSGSSVLESAAPSDAIILFDGKDLSSWADKDGNPTKWIVENGYMEAVKDAGSIFTKHEFGSCQLHIEWATPEKVTGKGQGRGNSGVFLMNRYEVQVLDSYNNITYPPGMAASVYGQNPPLVNASLPPGEWQCYDIIFHRPVFKDGKVYKPAVVTVFHNGVLVQDHFELLGLTEYKKVPVYREHPNKQPLSLQDHGNPVRYRNIWVRELTE